MSRGILQNNMLFEIIFYSFRDISRIYEDKIIYIYEDKILSKYGN